jgi:hypothetical protein
MKQLTKLIIITTLLSGCANYEYLASQPEDPRITFGDRFIDAYPKQGRAFSVNISETIKCADFKRTGQLSTNWMDFAKSTRDIYVPKNKKISIMGSHRHQIGYTISQCDTGTISFYPESSKHYSADILIVNNKCAVSIKEVLPDGTHSDNEIRTIREKACVEK